MPPQARPAVRWLQANAGTETPSQILLYDTETRWKTVKKSKTQTHHRFRLGVAIHCVLSAGKVVREQTHRFTEIGEFWALLERLQQPRKVLWAFAHNHAVDLEWLRFWGQVEMGAYTAGPVRPEDAPGLIRGKRPWRGRVVWGGQPSFLFLLGKRGRVNFVDTFNYWRGSLQKAAEGIGGSKLKMPDMSEPDSAWFPYCEQDVQILRDLVVGALAHWKDLNAGVWQPTAPALALQSFRHQELTPAPKRKAKSILLDGRAEDAALERDGYYGGYFGAFYLGQIVQRDDPAPFKLDGADGTPIALPKGPVYKIDCNGLYPYVMSRNYYPCKRLSRRDGIEPAKLRRLMHASAATARVLISATNREYPCRADGHLLYQVGRYWTTLCGPELRRALDHGDVLEVAECCLYRTAKLFDRWVKFWHGERLKARAAGDRPREDFTKLILNSLYGKFGQKGGGWVNCDPAPTDHPYGEWIELRDAGAVDPESGEPCFEQVKKRSLGGIIQTHVEGADPAHSFPAIAAHVTSYAREYMRCVRAMLPAKSCFYQGTDSLLINESALDTMQAAGLIDPTALGHFKLEGVFLEGEMVGANHYRLEKKITRSGHYGRADYRLDGKAYANIWEGANSFTARRTDGVVIVTEVELRTTDPYPKGVEMPDGWVQWRVTDTVDARVNG